jgi:hypothetical protein
MYDRLNYKSVFSLTPGKSRAIFLEEISVEGLVQKDLPILKQKVYDLMDKKLREYKTSWIKTVNSQCSIVSRLSLNCKLPLTIHHSQYVRRNNHSSCSSKELHMVRTGSYEGAIACGLSCGSESWKK